MHYLNMHRYQPSTACIVMLLFITGCKKPTEVSADALCRHQTTVIAKALTSYTSARGPLLPALTTTGDQQQYEYSWRVALGEFIRQDIEGRNNFDYDFNRDWDSEQNRRKVVDLLYGIYLCPAESRDPRINRTSFLMIVAPNDSKSIEYDNTVSSRVLIVESAGCEYEIGEPRDIEWDDLWKGDSPFGFRKLNSFHPSVVRAIKANGEVIEISKSLDKEAVKAIIVGRNGPLLQAP